MKELEERIRKEGIVLGGDVLKVDSFLNHQVDTAFLSVLGKEFARRFAGSGVNKILTVEASGIAVAMAAAPYFGSCPVVFAKKGNAANQSADCYGANLHSYTRGIDYSARVSRNYLTKEDTVLILDDFLANGEALNALIDIVRQSGARLAGCGIVIEKAYQPGGARIRGLGVRVESLARIAAMAPGQITFAAE